MPAFAGMTTVYVVAIVPNWRHCERSEAIQIFFSALDCFLRVARRNDGAACGSALPR